MLLTARLSVYLFKIGQKLHRGEYVEALMRCPECEIEAVDFTHEQAEAHVVIRQKIESSKLYYVVVGCEGYWTVDPKTLGLPRGNWSPSFEILKKRLDLYIAEGKDFSRIDDEEVTESNKAEIAAVINMDDRLDFGEKANLLSQLDY